MTEDIKARLENLKVLKKELKPRIDGFNLKREEEIKEINDKYDNLISVASIDVDKVENELNNDIINSYIKAIMDEFDAKRSVSEYIVTPKIKEDRDFFESLENFPKKLIERLDEVISGATSIETLAYDIEKIENEYLTT